MTDIVDRLLRNPMICFDKSNLTEQAAEEIIRLRGIVATQNADLADLMDRQAEIERLRDWCAIFTRYADHSDVFEEAEREYSKYCEALSAQQPKDNNDV